MGRDWDRDEVGRGWDRDEVGCDWDRDEVGCDWDPDGVADVCHHGGDGDGGGVVEEVIANGG